MRPEYRQEDEKDESLLWSKFKAGDQSAFAEIYRLHIRGLIQYGSKISLDSQVVQDAIQDLFLELWHSRQRLSATTSVRFYLFRALRNKLSKSFNADFSLDAGTDFLSEPSVEFLMMENERREDRLKRLRTALDTLTPRQQEAINLRFFHDFSNEEVASMMGLNYQSACKLIYSGLRLLKENMSMLLLMCLFFS